MIDDSASHHDHHEGHRETPPVRDEAYWDEFYGAREAVWSGNPNPQLVQEVGPMVPGRALDVGCGEGADAIWLAGRGWDTTGLEISSTALDRARAHATNAGPDVEARLTWLRADMDECEFDDSFTLVSLQFIHLGPAERVKLHERVARAVAPGGILLIVGHDPSDLHTSVHRPPFPEYFATAEEMARAFPKEEWEVLVAEARPRQVTDSSGNAATIQDAVLKVRRRLAEE